MYEWKCIENVSAIVTMHEKGWSLFVGVHWMEEKKKY